MKANTNMNGEPVVTRVSAGVSAVFATTSFITHAQEIVSLVAGVVAILAGLFAIANYLRHGGTLNPFEIWKQRNRKKHK